MARLSMGYFADFHVPTLLIWGDAAGLQAFADFLGDLPDRAPQRSDVALPDWIARKGEAEIVLHVPSETTLLAVETKDDKPVLTWRIAAPDAARFSELVAVVARGPGAGHHYLDGDTPCDVDVKASRGEYDDW